MEGSGKLDSIVIATLPDAAVGCLTLGAQGIQVGDVIAMEAVSYTHLSHMVKIVHKKVLNPSVTLLEVEAPLIAKKAKACLLYTSRCV